MEFLIHIKENENKLGNKILKKFMSEYKREKIKLVFHHQSILSSSKKLNALVMNGLYQNSIIGQTKNSLREIYQIIGEIKLAINIFNTLLFEIFIQQVLIQELMQNDKSWSTICLENNLFCQICIREFDNQTLIPLMICSNMHNLCSECFIAIKQKEGQQFPCPHCRQKTFGDGKILKNRTLIQCAQHLKTIGRMEKTKNDQHMNFLYSEIIRLRRKQREFSTFIYNALHKSKWCYQSQSIKTFLDQNQKIEDRIKELTKKIEKLFE